CSLACRHSRCSTTALHCAGRETLAPARAVRMVAISSLRISLLFVRGGLCNCHANESPRRKRRSAAKVLARSAERHVVLAPRIAANNCHRGGNGLHRVREPGPREAGVSEARVARRTATAGNTTDACARPRAGTSGWHDTCTA